LVPVKSLPEPCVVTRIHGGLGNQLFQYAAGHALARRLGVPHKLDIRAFTPHTERPLGLREFALPLSEASADELRRLAPQWGPGWRNKWILWRHRLTSFHRRRWVHEEGFDFDARLFAVRPPCYLDGYWQSEKYFADCADEIRRMFHPARAPAPPLVAVATDLAQRGAVAVHVRRGDYVHNRGAAQFHGCCPAEYYSRAAAWMREQLPRAPFCVFSDDQEWARTNLRIEEPVQWMETTPARSAHEDFFLLCSCAHFIIANSSFSWWPAWMTNAPGRRVVAPRRWFLGYDVKPEDRFPTGWHLLDF
jgi:hypothetical protein